MLKVENLSVSHGESQVLFGISFTVKEGEIVSLVGANGAGKTTLLRTISGILKPLSGNIMCNDKDMAQLQPHQIVLEGIVQVPEGRRLFPSLTVEENLKLGAYNKNARKDMDNTLREVFDILPTLKKKQKSFAGNMSGGEQQMCAIGRALMAKPKLLLLDEPSLGLAPLIVKGVFRLVTEINSMGMAILMVEQNVQHALSISSSACVLESGHLVLQGKGDEILGNPQLKKAFLGLH